jgi:hypothetical protein
MAVIPLMTLFHVVPIREVEITIVHLTKQAQSILATPFSISGAGFLTALSKRGS